MKTHASMNLIYRLILTQVLNAWVAVAEITRGQGKGAGRKLIATTALLLNAALVQAAPDGGQVVTGTGSITQSSATITSNQASQNLSLTWASFNIAPTKMIVLRHKFAPAMAKQCLVHGY